MALFDDLDWRRRGFDGFAVIGELGRPKPLELPEASGVYVVLRSATGQPVFLSTGGGGRWKGSDPTVPIERLEGRWIDGTPILYIGKAKSLRERVGELLRFSEGEARPFATGVVGSCGSSDARRTSSLDGARSRTLEASSAI